MMRVVCDFLLDASSARSRNRMRQSYAKVVPSKSALSLSNQLVKPSTCHCIVIRAVSSSQQLAITVRNYSDDEKKKTQKLEITTRQHPCWIFSLLHGQLLFLRSSLFKT